MIRPFLFSTIILMVLSISSFSQSIEVSIDAGIDTSGMSSAELLSLERSVELELSSMGSGSDTLVVELGPEEGSYDLFIRNFPLSQTGDFPDGCSLSNTGGLTVGLGKFTGITQFYVRAYLKSSGVGSATILSN